MSYTLKNNWGTSVVVTAIAVLAPFADGGGGGIDNDSPFGAPKSSSGSTDEPPAFASSGDCEGVTAMAVEAAPGASLSFDALAKMGPKAVLTTDAVLEGDLNHAFVSHGDGVFEDLEVTAGVSLPAGAEVHAVSAPDGYALEGRFAVAGDVRVALRASAKTAHQMAFLLIGEPTSDGTGFKAQHVLQIPLQQSRVDVTALRDALAPYHEALAGKVAQVHLFGYELHVPGSWVLNHEAVAWFNIEPDATIEVDTAP